MRFGILESKGGSHWFFSIILGLLGLISVGNGCFRLSEALNNDLTVCVVTILVGLGMIVGAIALGRGSKYWRAGYRPFRGTIWDSSKSACLSGNFLLKVADGHSVHDFVVLTDDPSKCIQNKCPELILWLYVASGVTQTGLKLHSAYFAGKQNINGASLKILAGDEIWHFKGLRGLGLFMRRLGSDTPRVRMLVRSSILHQNVKTSSQGGLSGPTLGGAVVGGVLSAATGVVPIVGLVAGQGIANVLGSSHNQEIEQLNQDKQSSLIFLKKVANEFGWTLEFC